MIPRTKRKRIIVGGETWYYSVSGYTSVFVKNYKTGEEIRYYEDNKPKWKREIVPSIIRRIILKYKDNQKKDVLCNINQT